MAISDPHRRSALLLCAGLMGGMLPQVSGLQAQSGTAGSHVAWVGEVLKRMLTIQPSMTREALLKVFTTEGGISTRLRRTFISRDCKYFKVDVDFRAVRGPYSDDQGRVAPTEDPRDLIVAISRPYLAFSVLD